MADQNPSPTPAAPTDKKNNAVSLIGKIIAGVVLALVVLVVIVLVLVGVAGPGFVQSAIANKTGFAVRSQKFAINPLGGRVELKEFAIDNPANFGGGAFLTIPELVVQADLLSFLGQPYRVKELTLHVGTVRIIRNSEGLSNAQEFTKKLNPQEKNKPAQASPQTAQKPAEQKPLPKVNIDHLKLKIDSITIVNQAVKPEKVTTVNLSFVFERNNVTDLETLKTELAAEAATTVLRNLGSRALTEIGGSALGNAGKAAILAEKLLGSGATEAGSAASKAAEKVKGLINIFKNK